MENIYFDLTIEFNEPRPIAVLTSGPAVVWYRTAIMSKDGDWILEESPAACARVLEVLGDRGARYRTGAPLDVRWLSGGWSAHFEFRDDRDRRVRCDFLTRPPRLSASDVEEILRSPAEPGAPRVIDPENLIRMKRTQRAKDYAVIGELARRLPPEREILLTTDPDRIVELAPEYGEGVERSPVIAARESADREDVVVALARETYALQEADRKRVERYEAASREFRARVLASDVGSLPLATAHERIVELAEECLPTRVPEVNG